jgi:hypothetical protein
MPRRRHVQLPHGPLLTALTTVAIVETMWTTYIGWRLPRHYVAEHWSLAWVGLDVAQVIVLLLAAWAAWRGHALLILFTTSAGTLLVIDAWFDVTTARHGDFRQSLILALVLEIPFAMGLFWITHRAIQELTGEMIVGYDAAGAPLRQRPALRRASRNPPGLS